MAIRIYIDGQAGTTGLELQNLLAARQDLELLTISDAERKDPAARQAQLQAADVAILCLPDAAAREAVALLGSAATRVIDASTAHRTRAGWQYGLPELGDQRQAIRDARFVANPGCYPQGYVLVTSALREAGLLAATAQLTVHAVSGYSGGGRSMIERYQAANGRDQTLVVRPYGLTLAHKHVPEMLRYSGLNQAPVFCPSVADYYKGMLVQLPLHLPSGTTAEAVHAALQARYETEPFITVKPFGRTDGQDEGFLPADGCNDTNRMDLFVFGHETQALVIARYDNLGKGAAGSAVQCLNLMIGAPETRGLPIATPHSEAKSQNGSHVS